MTVVPLQAQTMAAAFATRPGDHLRGVTNAVIRTNLAYARKTRGEFPHARALVMAEAITNAVRNTDWRAS